MYNWEKCLSFCHRWGLLECYLLPPVHVHWVITHGLNIRHSVTAVCSVFREPTVPTLTARIPSHRKQFVYQIPLLCVTIGGPSLTFLTAIGQHLFSHSQHWNCSRISAWSICIWQTTAQQLTTMTSLPSSHLTTCIFILIPLSTSLL